MAVAFMRLQRSERVWLILIILGGLSLRLWLWGQAPLHQPANDEHEYLQVARDLVAGRGWIFYESYHWLRAPLYPLFLSGSLLLTGGNLQWAALPNIAVSTLTIHLFYLLGRAVALSSPAITLLSPTRAHRVGLICAGISAASLPFATFASLWMSETLFAALFVSAALVLVQWSARPTLRRAVVAGLLLGLTTLTRSLPLFALPPLMIWMLLQHPVKQASRARLVGALLCLAVALGTIAPWTARNWLAYGSLIPVETGLSYNMWAFWEPKEDIDTIFQTLETISNPAERAAFATEKGLQRLREDPAIIVRNAPRNWHYLWAIKPIQDRFLQPTYFGDVPHSVFALGLVLDDGLYLLILISGVMGLVLAPRSSAKTLLGGWLVYVLLVVLVTHGEGRYRQILYPILLPYAAGLLSGGWWIRATNGWRAIALCLALVGWLPIRSYPYEWAAIQVRRGIVEATGDRAMARGAYQDAQAAYLRAASIDDRSADVLLKLGRSYDDNGELERAIQAYGWAAAVAPPYVATSVALGDALRRAGDFDAARRAFAGSYSDPRAISDWAWSHLASPAPSVIDVGGGLDIGFVGGMYAAEEVDGRSIRWTTGEAAIRVQGGQSGTVVKIRLAANRPDGQATQADICVTGRCHSIEVDNRWRTYHVLLPPTPAKDAECAQAIGEGSQCSLSTLVLLRSPTFTPSEGSLQPVTSEDRPGSQPTGSSSDDRPLGLQVDYVRAEPLP